MCPLSFPNSTTFVTINQKIINMSILGFLLIVLLGLMAFALIKDKDNTKYCERCYNTPVSEDVKTIKGLNLCESCYTTLTLNNQNDDR